VLVPLSCRHSHTHLREATSRNVQKPSMATRPTLRRTRFAQASEVQIAVIANPYLAINLRYELEMVSSDERRSFASARRRTTPCSISLSTRRRTVVRELKFSRRTCLSVNGRLISSAYPISIKISKSITDLMNGSCTRSSSLIFLSASNSFIIGWDVASAPHHGVVFSWWQGQLGAFLAPKCQRGMFANISRCTLLK
jgi:hypothetical protein